MNGKSAARVAMIGALAAAAQAEVVIDLARSGVRASVWIDRQGQSPIDVTLSAPLGGSLDTGLQSLGPVGRVDARASLQSAASSGNVFTFTLEAASWCEPLNDDDTIIMSGASADVYFEVIGPPVRVTLDAPAHALETRSTQEPSSPASLSAGVIQLVPSGQRLVTDLASRQSVDGVMPMQSSVVLPPGQYVILVSAGSWTGSVVPGAVLAGTARTVDLRLQIDAPCTRPGDANGDGQVNFLDLAIVLGNFGDGCPQP